MHNRFFITYLRHVLCLTPQTMCNLNQSYLSRWLQIFLFMDSSIGFCTIDALAIAGYSLRRPQPTSEQTTAFVSHSLHLNRLQPAYATAFIWTGYSLHCSLGCWTLAGQKDIAKCHIAVVRTQSLWMTTSRSITTSLTNTKHVMSSIRQL